MSTRSSGTQAGFSLIELLIALTILGVILASLFGLTVSMQRQHFQTIEKTRAEDAARLVDLTLRAVLRTAGADPFVTNADVFNPGSAPPFRTLRVTSDFNPPDRDFNDPMEDISVRVLADSLMVRWRAGGPEDAYAYPVDSLTFTFFDRSGTVLTTRAAVEANAIRVRFRFVMQTDPSKPSMLLRRESWVYLRNRR